MHAISGALNSAALRPVMYVRKLLFDETPTKVRVRADEVVPWVGSQTDQSDRAKVMQTAHERGSHVAAGQPQQPGCACAWLEPSGVECGGPHDLRVHQTLLAECHGGYSRAERVLGLLPTPGLHRHARQVRCELSRHAFVRL